MAKKIKQKHELTEEERKAEETRKAEEASRAAAGIQDEFQARGFELVHWVQERQTLVLSVLAVFVLAGIGYGVASAVRASRASDASEALAEALEAWNAPVGDEADAGADGPHYPDTTARTKAARDLFVKAADAYDGTGAGSIAHLYAGHAALRLGEHDEAIARYQAFLDAISKKDPLRYAGFAGLAHALEAKGDKGAAIAKLEALVALPQTIEEDAALLDLGRLYAAQGDVARARVALERLTKDFPESVLVSRGEEQLAKLPASDETDETDEPDAPSAPASETP